MVMSKWEEKRLGEVAPFNYGKSKVSENRDNGQYKVFSSAGFCGYSNETIANYGIIIGRKGSAGSLFYSKSPFFSIDTTFYVDKVAESTDIKFIYYYLQILNLKIYNNDAAVPGLNRNLAHNLKVKLPPLPTQQKMANILSTYDDLIENNNRRIELLVKAAQDLYKEWFVRFRFPNYKQTKFDNGLPQGWEVVKIGDIVNITSSKRVYLSDYVESGIPFYRSKEVIQLSKGQAITEQLYISEEKYFEFRDKYGVPQKNDILLTSVGTIGIPMLVSNSELFYFKDGNLTWIQSSSNIELSYYLFAWLNSEIGKQQIFSSTIGTSQSALTIENLKNIKIIKPMNEIIIKYKKFSEEILNEINNLQNQNNNLIKQRDLLLPRLMSGKLEVK